jgi:F-type H+-transporting ATPase subunit delta
MPDLANLVVARRYAAALVSLAVERGKLAEVADDLSGLKRAVEAEPGILKKLADPRATGAEKRALVAEKLEKGRHELVKNLLGTLARRRRETLLPDLFFALGEEIEKASGVLRVELETATPADPAFAADLAAKLGAATSRTVALEQRVRPEILGGLRIFVESKLVDASVASKLDRLKKQLLTARG